MLDLDWSLFILFKAPPYALTRISPSLVPRSFSTLPPSEGNYYFAYLNAKLFAEMSSREYQQFCNARSKATANSGIASKLSANQRCTPALIFPTLDLPTGRILLYYVLIWYFDLGSHSYGSKWAQFQQDKRALDRQFIFGDQRNFGFASLYH